MIQSTGPEQPEFIVEELEPTLAYRAWWPLLAGVVSGILLRLAFNGKLYPAFQAMAGSFILVAPAVVGAVTVYVAELQKRRKWSYYFWAPFVANMFFVLGTLIIMIEGIICAIIIAPLFGLIGIVGGVAMGAVCRWTDWPKRAVYSIGVLPFLLGDVEHQFALPTDIRTIERSVLVNATPEAIWQHLQSAEAIRPDEVQRGWLYRIGVPLPKYGVLEQTADGPVRHVAMGKGIHFDQVAIAWEPNRRVKWVYQFADDSFPPGALDDHVRIGGEYFDLLDTEYRLSPVGDKTELSVSMSYRVSTRFNWYARPVAQLLIGNFEEVILDFYSFESDALKTTRASS